MLRKERGLSLSEVAGSTQISASFLSLVENGRSDITVGRLTRLLRFYDVPITELLPSGARAAESHVVRREEQQLIHSPAEGIDVYLLVHDHAKTMMAMLLTFEPAARLAEYGRHPGEEFVHVLEGELLLELEGMESTVLRAGDSAYYRGEHPHSFTNAKSDQPLQLICVDSPPPL
jgi:quercetin dioxygenase-like cupin family protein